MKTTHHHTRLASAILLALTLTACGPLTFTVGTSQEDQQLKTTTVESQNPPNNESVAIIDITGIIANASQFQILGKGENPVSLLHEKLELARTDNNIKAVILRINSPGGTVTASDAMYRQILRFKERSGKPVIALLMDVAASGGYYTACAADSIVAYPTSITGSIGVIIQTVSLKPALDRLGIKTDAITSGPNKDSGSILSTLTPQQRKILQEIVDDFYAGFINVVTTSRTDIKPENLQAITDGRVFTGKNALTLGLVDHTGDLYDAFELAKEKANIKLANLIIYHRPLTYAGSPYATTSPNTPASASPHTQINIAQFNLYDTFAGSSVGFYYLWHPTLN